MIKNKTRKIVLSRNEKICCSFLSKIKGLMFTLKPKTLIFVNKKEMPVSIHMFFVFYPIDVAWLDKKKRLIDKQRLNPFSGPTKAIVSKYVIELPVGSLNKTKIGDKLEFNA